MHHDLLGLGAAAKALVTGPATLSTIRFIEGAAQAGFFPGVIYYLTLWFPPQYRARALAWFLVSIPASAVIGGPVAVTLLQWTRPRPFRVAVVVLDRGSADRRLRPDRALCDR